MYASYDVMMVRDAYSYAAAAARLEEMTFWKKAQKATIGGGLGSVWPYHVDDVLDLPLGLVLEAGVDPIPPHEHISVDGVVEQRRDHQLAPQVLLHQPG